MPDPSVCVKLLHIADVLRVHAGVPVFERIDVVDHPEVDVTPSDPREEVLERRFHELHITSPDILPVLPGRADMPLHKPFVPTRRDGFSDDIAGFRVRHPTVDDVDPAVSRVSDQSDPVFLGMPLQPFPAETDLADIQFRFAKSSGSHVCPPGFSLAGSTVCDINPFGSRSGAAFFLISVYYITPPPFRSIGRAVPP